MHYVPIGLPFYIAFWILLGLVLVLIEIGILQYVLQSMGVSRRYMFSLLLLSLLGSYVNIPVAEFPAEHMRSGELVDFYGVEYVVPVMVTQPGTVLAVNVGGAIIPVVLSIYLMIRHRLYVSGLLAVAFMAVVVHKMAQPVQGLGIAVPIFIPPLLAALTAILISRRRAGPLAYVAGSLGTLIGADLMNLGRIRGLGAPMASIGGAGKFDGIFLTGLVAVLLAGVIAPWSRRPRREWRNW
ncbi:MAG TPA: DUF1614 domain-containing protein [Candidatus Acidoferrum sp.]|nr:DUF1614 domain-containing protein [Candidatus Acidoferrum sp.]